VPLEEEASLPVVLPEHRNARLEDVVEAAARVDEGQARVQREVEIGVHFVPGAPERADRAVGVRRGRTPSLVSRFRADSSAVTIPCTEATCAAQHDVLEGDAGRRPARQSEPPSCRPLDENTWMRSRPPGASATTNDPPARRRMPRIKHPAGLLADVDQLPRGGLPGVHPNTAWARRSNTRYWPDESCWKAAGSRYTPTISGGKPPMEESTSTRIAPCRDAMRSRSGMQIRKRKRFTRTPVRYRSFPSLFPLSPIPYPYPLSPIPSLAPGLNTRPSPGWLPGCSRRWARSLLRGRGSRLRRVERCDPAHRASR